MQEPKRWLVDLAEKELDMIKSKGSDHEETQAAREQYKQAWLAVRAIESAYKRPSPKENLNDSTNR